ncbi:MAG: LPP20 family lipoprotein [Gammaproteobacteria bacterium]|nr:LPP20 family lipoprotein [Gammaproteobacteria bacterium]MCF6363032.1 LPP20 family lipoprotein [Gammaproteobacteria bacterium]
MRIVLLALMSLMTACASTGDGSDSQPDWISGKSSQFPVSQYLVGRGQASLRDMATDRARADLAKNIEVQVVAESRDTVSAQRQTQDGEVVETFSEAAGRDIVTSTRQVIRGARVADTWQNPQSGDIHVLVSLNRAETARRLRDEMSLLDDQTRVAIERARQTDDLLQKIASAQRAVDKQRQRSELQRVLRVVGRGGQGVSPKWKLANLQGELLDLQSRLKIRVQADDGTLASVVAGGLTAAGFMTGSEEEALYTLQTRFSAGPAAQRESWYWLRGNLELKLVDRGDNVRGTASWPLKVSAQEKALLQPRLMQLIDRTLEDELRAVILGFAR